MSPKLRLLPEASVYDPLVRKGVSMINVIPSSYITKVVTGLGVLKGVLGCQKLTMSYIN